MADALCLCCLRRFCGRRVEPEREGMVHVFGMLLLLGLMALMIVNDIVNPILQ